MFRLNNLTVIICYSLINYGVAQKTDILKIEIPLEVSIPVGGTADIGLGVIINEKFHIQANPASDDFLIPSKIEINAMEGVIIGNPVYPKGESFWLEGTDNPLSVYSGKFSIHIPINISSGILTGKYKLNGKFYYQACDSSKCYAPRSLFFIIPVNVYKKS